MSECNPLSFEEIAQYVAKTIDHFGRKDAELQCIRFQRNLGWDSQKLFARALDITQGSAHD